MTQTTTTQTQIEKTMLNDLKELGATELMIKYYSPSGELLYKRIYSRLIYAVRKMIDHAQGEFPVYNGSSVMSMGYKMEISYN